MLTSLKRFYQKLYQSVQNQVKPNEALYHSEKNLTRPNRRNRTQRFNVVDIIRDIEMLDNTQKGK